MALRLSYETASGVTATDAYHKVQNLRTTKTGADAYRTRIMVATYYNEAARTEGKPPLATRSWAMPYDIETSNNVFVDAYTYLKTLPEFAGAVDV